MTSIDRHLPFIARACLVLLFPFSGWTRSSTKGTRWCRRTLRGCRCRAGCRCCSVGILLNIYARQFASLFCFYCVVTAVLFHNFWIYPFGSAEWLNDFWPFLENFGLVGGFLFVATDAKMQPLARSFTLEPRPRA